MQKLILVIISIIIIIVITILYFGYKKINDLTLQLNRNSLDISALRNFIEQKIINSNSFNNNNNFNLNDEFENSFDENNYEENEENEEDEDNNNHNKDENFEDKIGNKNYINKIEHFKKEEKIVKFDKENIIGFLLEFGYSFFEMNFTYFTVCLLLLFIFQLEQNVFITSAYYVLLIMLLSRVKIKTFLYIKFFF